MVAGDEGARGIRGLPRLAHLVPLRRRPQFSGHPTARAARWARLDAQLLRAAGRSCARTAGRALRPDRLRQVRSSAGHRMECRCLREELAALRDQLGLERIHLLGTSWGGMLAQQHVLSGAAGIVSLTLSSTLANLALWNEEQLKLRNALPPEVVAVLDRHEQAGTYDDPEYAQALEPYFDRHFYRGPQPRAELVAMDRGRAPDVYRAMQGPNEWTTTGALKGWDTRDRLHEINVPTLVLRGRYDMCTEPIAAELVNGISGAREVVFGHSSHTPVLEETDRYLEVVGDFLREAGD